MALACWVWHQWKLASIADPPRSSKTPPCLWYSSPLKYQGWVETEMCHRLTAQTGLCFPFFFLYPSSSSFCFCSLCTSSLFFLSFCPNGHAFAWWGCCGLCLRHKPTELAHSFLFCSCVCFCLYGPFNCISFHKFSRQHSAFLVRSSGLISALLVLSAIELFLKVSLSPDIMWLTGLKAPTN